MQTNPEQWAVEVREVETVTGDFGTEPGTPFYRIEIGGYCADFDCREGAQNFANAIQAAFAEREARLVEAAEGLLPHISHSIGCAVYQQSYVVRFPDCTCGADAARATLAALKDRTHG